MATAMRIRRVPNPLTLPRRWSDQSQRTACRNAMAGCSALSARRAEREDVAAFLAAFRGDPDAHDAHLDSA